MRFRAEARLSHRCSQMIDSAVFMLRAWFRLVFGISIIVHAGKEGVRDEGQVEDVRWVGRVGGASAGSACLIRSLTRVSVERW